MKIEPNIGSWEAGVEALIVGVVMYAALVAIVRVSGKRSVGKWNAFDLIVTVALGSMLATSIVSGTVPVVSGVAGVFVLILLQFVITWVGVRAKFLHRLVKATPVLLVKDGELQESTMRRERVTEAEVYAAMRRRGFGDIRHVRALVLETDGSFSVIGEVTDEEKYSTLRTVHGSEHS